MLAAWYQPENHPQFQSPPVVETAMALEFPPAPDLNLYRLMRLQTAWDTDYPQVSDVIGAPPTSIGGDAAPIMFFGSEPPKRIWAEAVSNGLLIQTQADRLILNWRKAKSVDPYPGYADLLRPEYFRLWGIFCDALKDLDLQVPIPVLAEFTYVNVVELELGERPVDVLTVLGEAAAQLPGTDQHLRFEFTRAIAASDSDPFSGQVRVVGESGLVSEAKRALQFTVTAQVLLDSARSDDAATAIDAAHGLASYTFSSIVSSTKKELWQKIQ